MGTRKLTVILTVGIVIASLVGFSLLRLYMSPASTSGIVITNESVAEAAFAIDSDFRDGNLLVPPGSAREFDVYVGFAVPSGFSIRITDMRGELLFAGQLRPGSACWSYFVWDGVQLDFQNQTICA